jgi:antitoxin (DNA-binding transcriptional repressor) of toxin-antitoxin stability system
VKKVRLETTTLDRCVDNLKRNRVLVTRNGDPVALIIGVEGLDEEQVELGSSEKFWRLIAARRKEKTISRAELEELIQKPSKARKRKVSGTK